MIEISYNVVYSQWHVMWKYNDKYFDVTNVEEGWPQNKNIVFVPSYSPELYNNIASPQKRFPNNKMYFFNLKNKPDKLLQSLMSMSRIDVI